MKWLTKPLSLALVLLAALAWASGVFAKDEDKAKQRPRCENCGMYVDRSSTAVEAQITVDGTKGAHVFESVDCMHTKLKEWSDSTLHSFTVIDYSTWGKKTVKKIDGMKAFYLYDTKKLPGSMSPYIAAFLTKDSAEKAQGELGGKLVGGYKQLAKLIEAANSEDAGKSSHDH